MQRARSILAGRLDNTKAFLDRHPEYLKARNGFNSTVLHFACMIGRSNDQVAILKDLLARGPASNLRVKNIIYGTPLQLATTFYDSDPEAIRLLIEAGGAKGAKVRSTNSRQIRFVFKPLSSMLGKDKGAKTNPVMYGFRKMIRTLPGTHRATPAHNAAKRGDVVAMQVLATQAPGLMTSAKNKAGKTPLQVALEVTSGSSEQVPKLIERLVREAEAAQQAPPRANVKPKGKPDQVLPNASVVPSQ